MNAHVAVAHPEGVKIIGPTAQRVVVGTDGLFTHYQEVAPTGVDLELVAVTGVNLEAVSVTGVNLELVDA